MKLFSFEVVGSGSLASLFKHEKVNLPVGVKGFLCIVKDYNTKIHTMHFVKSKQTKVYKQAIMMSDYPVTKITYRYITIK